MTLTAPPTYCRGSRTCPYKKGSCPNHGGARQPWEGQTQERRITGRKLQKLRAQLFQTHPLCVQCQKEGRIRLATIRDHIVPLAEGGRDDDTNVQGLCRECSDTKTRQESARGVTRR